MTQVWQIEHSIVSKHLPVISKLDVLTFLATLLACAAKPGCLASSIAFKASPHHLYLEFGPFNGKVSLLL